MKKDNLGWAWKGENISPLLGLDTNGVRYQVIKLLNENGHSFTRNTSSRRLVHWLAKHYGRSLRMAGLKKSRANLFIKAYGKLGPAVFEKLPTIEEDKINRRTSKKKKAEYNGYSGFYETDDWRKLRYRALLNNGRVCQCCGAKPPDVVLHVDHIKPRSLHPELELSLENLQILCEDCNLGKSNRDDTDFRP